MLPVDDLQTLYWEESGNPGGVPVVYVHGGPGEGAPPDKRLFWDPEHYRIVLFDQRGALRSTPLAELRNNTTQALINDIETLREHLGIDQWLITAGSWGTTLALAYGEAHPQRCLGFILRGIFLGTGDEIDWIIQGGHDMIATPNSAFRLYKAWPGSVLTVVNDAGHSPSETGIISALIEATEQFKAGVAVN